MHPSTVADLLRALQPEPGRPRLTWYGPGGERVELSGAVLENWVAKTSNLLVEELDAAPGTRVVLDLPAHWRTVVWALATWRVGAGVVLPADGTRPAGDVVVTDRPGSHAGGAPLVAVTLGALARRFDGDLPPGAVDAASSVMTYGDTIGWAPAVDAGAPALDAPTGTVLHGQLGAWATSAVPTPPGARTLVPAPGGAPRAASAEHLLAATWSALAGHGSVVALDRTTTDALADDAARRARLVDSERITAQAAAPAG